MMQKKFHNFVFGVSVLPALLVMPAMAVGRESVSTTVTWENQNISHQDFLITDAVTRDNNPDFGGYAFIDRPGNLTVNNSVYTELTFDGSGAVFATRIPSGEIKAQLNVNETVFKNNHALRDGGAIGNFNELSVTNSRFIGNTALLTKDENGNYTVAVVGNTPVGGGAIALGAVSSTSVKATSISDTLFENNKSGLNGGAIGTRLAKDATNVGAKLDISATFVGNEALQDGGAIYNTFYADNGLGKGDGVTVTGVFSGNKAGRNGGAIYSDGDVDKAGNHGGVMTITDSTFTGNTAKISAGAIFVKDAKVTVKNSSFTDNVATMYYGGAILTQGANSNLTILDSSFSRNKADVGGVLAELLHSGETVIKNSTFSNNQANEIGALYLLSSTALIDNSQFLNNKSINTESSILYDGGGALWMGSESTTNIKNSTFNGNSAGTDGGAMASRRFNRGNNVAATLDVHNSVFSNNTAGRNGGAFDNYLYNDANGDGYVKITDSKFNTNNALNGGAIYNHVSQAGEANQGQVGNIYLSNAEFVDNIASAKGGAIYNEGVVTLADTNTFAGNTVAGVANDIYNLGTVNIASGTTTMDGGITGTGTLTIANGAILNIGTAAVKQNSMALDGTLNATLLNTNKFASVDAANFASQEGAMNLTLKGVGDYKVFKHAVFNNSKISYTYDATLFSAPVWNEGKDTITVSMKPVEEIAANTGIKSETAAAVSHIAEAASKSESAQLQELSLKMQEKLASGDKEAVEHVSQAINPEKESVAQSVSTSVQNTVVSLASARMSAPSVGRNGGDVEFTSGGVWAQGLFNKSKQSDAFDGYTRGIALGMDGTINKDWTIGAGYSFAHSDISGTARDTKIDSNTVFVYGQYKPAEWYVNAIMNYTMSDYSERGTILDGIAIAGDYKVNSFGGALAAGYDFDNGITPELGLRYMHVSANDYANSYGIKTHMDDSNFLTSVIGAKYAFDVVANNHLTFAPQLNAGIKYDLVSDKNVATVTMPGLNAYTLDGNRLNRIGGEFGIGLGMQYREMEVSVNYDIDVRKDYTSQTGMLKFRYNF